MAFCLKIKFVCQRSECASTLGPPARLFPVLSIIPLNHLKSGCRNVKKRGDVYGIWTGCGWPISPGSSCSAKFGRHSGNKVRLYYFFKKCPGLGALIYETMGTTAALDKVGLGLSFVAFLRCRRRRRQDGIPFTYSTALPPSVPLWLCFVTTTSVFQLGRRAPFFMSP